MSRRTGDAEFARSCLAPRDGASIFEVAEGPTDLPVVGGDPREVTYTVPDGPWRIYSRRLTVTAAGDDRFVVEQSVHAKLDIPVFGGLFDLLGRRELRAFGPARQTMPWYSPPVPLELSHTRLLGLLCTAAVVSGYLSGLVTRVLTYAVAEFRPGLATKAQSQLVTQGLSGVRVGVIIGFLALAFADKVGRRRMLLITAGIGLVCAVATAAAPGLGWMVGLQLVTRNLANVMPVLLVIVAAEELPAGSRAYATGVIGMSYALGQGVVLMLLPLSDVSVWGWRLVCGGALIFAPVVLRLMPQLPETQRFSAAVADPAPPVRGRAAAVLLGRLAVLALLFLALNVNTAPASQLQTDYLRTVRSYSASLSSLFLLITNTPGAIGVVLGGRISDVRGRRIVGVVGLIGIILQAGIYIVGGWAMWMVSLVSAIVGGMAVPTLGVFGPELFPTRWRGTANGVLTVTAVIGAVVGLSLASHLIGSTSYAHTFWVLGAFPLVSILMLAFLPETAKQDLDGLSAPSATSPPVTTLAQ